MSPAAIRILRRMFANERFVSASDARNNNEAIIELQDLQYITYGKNQGADGFVLTSLAIHPDKAATPCPGCGRMELHKMCPAHGTKYYISGILFTEEMEKTEKAEAVKVAPFSQPTAEGMKRHPPDGFIFGEPCTCKTLCPATCKGECGCKGCKASYSDDQSSRHE